MKILNVISQIDSKENKKDIEKIRTSLIKKIQFLDLDIRNIRKSDYLIHDFFIIKSFIFFVYKYKQYRILLMLDITNQVLIMIKIYVKKKKGEKYYNEFREFAARKAVI